MCDVCAIGNEFHILRKAYFKWKFELTSLKIEFKHHPITCSMLEISFINTLSIGKYIYR